MDIFNVVTRSHICREFNCHKDTIKRWIKEEGFPELIQPRQNGGQARPDHITLHEKKVKSGFAGLVTAAT